MAAGATISGWAYFQDNEGAGCTFDETADVKVDGTTVFSADACTTNTVPWTPWSHTFAAAGTYTVEARIAYRGFFSSKDSFMGLDDVEIVTPVGGVTSFVSGSESSSGSIALLAGGVAVVVAIIATSAWCTRRHWLGSSTIPPADPQGSGLISAPFYFA